MVDTLRIKRRAAGGAAGAPSSLAAAEIAFNEQDQTLYYGAGNSGGFATSIYSIGGPGAFLPLAGGTLSGGLTINSISNDTTAQLYLRPSVWAAAQISEIRFGGTFHDGTTDYGARYTASLRSGFSTGAWYGEFLDVWVNNQPNDAASDAYQSQIARFANAGITTYTMLSANGGLTAWNSAVMNTLLNVNAGVTFNSHVVSSPQDLSRGIDMYGGVYGFNITAGSLNYNVGGGNAGHYFWNGSTQCLAISAGNGIAASVPATFYGTAQFNNPATFNNTTQFNNTATFTAPQNVAPVWISCNLNATPPASGFGGYLGFNFSAGNCEFDFLNAYSGGYGGFSFYQWNGTTYNRIAQLTSDGTLTLAAGLTASQAVTTPNLVIIPGATYPFQLTTIGGTTGTYALQFQGPNWALNYISATGEFDVVLNSNKIMAFLPTGTFTNYPITSNSTFTVNGTATFNGALAANGVIQIGANIGGVVQPPFGGGYIAWNAASGQGDLAFINGYVQYGGFTWWQVTGTGTWNQLASLSPAGNLYLPHGNGVAYNGIPGGGNIIGFTWSSPYVSIWVEGGNQGQLATVGFANNKFLPLAGGVETGHVTFQQGIDFASGIGQTPQDLTYGVILWGTASSGYGFSITGSTLNYNAVGASVKHNFYADNRLLMRIQDADAVTMWLPLVVGGNIDGYNITSASGNAWVSIRPNIGGGYNPIVVAGDNALLFCGPSGAVGSGILTIAPWSNTSLGIRITTTTVTINGPTTINAPTSTVFTPGISFGQRTVNNANDVSQHISLYDGWGGFNITSGNLNIVAAGGVNMSLSGNNVSVYAPLLLSRDPVNSNEAVTLTYSDRNKGRNVVDMSSNSASPSTSAADYAYLYLYGSPTAPATLTLPVGTTSRLFWLVNNTTSQPVTVQGTGGGSLVVPSGGSYYLWTDTVGIYALANVGETRPPGDSTKFWATTAFVQGAIAGAGAISEAPTDGRSYSRRGSDHSWQAAAAGIAEAPTDGTAYGRVGSNASWVNVLRTAGGTLTGPLTLSGNAAAALQPVPLQQMQAQGYLTGNQTISLSGDVTGSGATSIAATLANTAVVAGSYTYASLTVDAKGRLTAASSGASPPGPATVAPLIDGSAAVGTSLLYARQDHVHPSQTVTLSGDVTGSGVGAITTTLAATAVTAGSYTFASLTVDAKGRLTAASSGTLPTSLPPSGPASGDLTGSYPAPSLVATAVTAGSYTYASLTVDAKGRLTAASNGAAPPGPATVAPLIDGTAAVGTSLLYARQDHVHPSQTVTLSGDVTGSGVGPITTTLASTAVTAGSYTFASLTVDAKGRLTAASSGTLPTSLPPSGAAGGDLTGTYPAPTLVTTAVVAGSYTYASLTVDAKGRLTAASNGAAPPGPATVAPLIDGTAAVGTSLLYARQDHVHASDTSRLAVAGGALTGGINFGAIHDSANNSMAQHVLLHTSGYGFGTRPNRLNYNTPTAAGHYFIVNSVDTAWITASAFTSAVPIVLPANPTTALQAVPKQYVDALVGVSVINYGAVGDGVTDDTVAFRNAIATGETVYIPKPPSSYLIKGMITCTTPGQIIYGDGKGVSIITVNSTFTPMTAQGVFYVNLPSPYVPGPQFRDFHINFVQPDTTVRANLTSYPPAFYAQNMARCVWRGIKINAAMIALDLRGNCGGCSVIDCELAGFTYSIIIDGSADSITIENTRIEPDALTSNQVQIFFSAGTIGIYSGRCDDIHINGCLLYAYVGFQVFAGSSGNTFGNVTNCDFDTYYGFVGSTGNISFAGCAFTLGLAACTSIQSSGGNYNFSGCYFYCSINPTNGQILLSPASGSETTVTFTGCQFWPQADGMTIQAAGPSSTCLLTITGCSFSLPAVAKTQPSIQVNSGALLTLGHCRWNPRGAGSGGALAISWDSGHNVVGNSFGGWTTSTTGANTIFANNNP